MPIKKYNEESAINITVSTFRTEVIALREEVMALKTVSNQIVALQEQYEEHDKILVRGNGKPSLQEDVRNLLLFVKSIRWWMTTLAVIFLGQFIAIGFSMATILIQLQPILEKLILER